MILVQLLFSATCPEIKSGVDLASGTFVHCCDDNISVESDEECRDICTQNADCTAWITNSPEDSSDIMCWMTSGPVSWVENDTRNGGLPCQGMKFKFEMR